MLMPDRILTDIMTRDIILEKGKTPPFYVVLGKQFHRRRSKKQHYGYYIKL